MALLNQADGSAVTLDATDVECGTWDTNSLTFSPCAAYLANAVRVTARRTQASGNSVKLSFASIIGQSTCDTQAVAIAAIDPPASPYGLVGLDHFASRGILTVDSYPSGNQGNIASNGDVTLNLLGLIGVSLIDGDVKPGYGHTIKKPLLSFLTNITGDTAPLVNPVYYPVVDATGFDTNNNNANLPGSAFNGTDFTAALLCDIPAGTYYVRNLTVLAGVIVRIQGPVTFYVTGDVTLAGTVLVLNNKASNFKVRVVGSGIVNLLANVTMVMDLYAPESSIYVTVGVVYWGSMIGKTVDILATSFIHYDESLSPPANIGQKIRLVK